MSVLNLRDEYFFKKKKIVLLKNEIYIFPESGNFLGKKSNCVGSIISIPPNSRLEKGYFRIKSPSLKNSPRASSFINLSQFRLSVSAYISSGMIYGRISSRWE